MNRDTKIDAAIAGMSPDEREEYERNQIEADATHEARHRLDTRAHADEMAELAAVQAALDERMDQRIREDAAALQSYAEMRIALGINHRRMRPLTEAEIKAEAEALRIKRRKS